jgi:hypothetical protein
MYKIFLGNRRAPVHSSLYTKRLGRNLARRTRERIAPLLSETAFPPGEVRRTHRRSLRSRSLGLQAAWAWGGKEVAGRPASRKQPRIAHYLEVFIRNVTD